MRHRGSRLIGLLPLIALGPNGISAWAGVIGVPTDYGSIQTAIDAAEPGGTIMVSAGLYSENITIDKPLILIGSGAASTIIATAAPPQTVVQIPANDVTFEGFSVHCLGTASRGIFVNDANRVVIRHCIVSGFHYGLQDRAAFEIMDAVEAKVSDLGVADSGDVGVSINSGSGHVLDGICVENCTAGYGYPLRLESTSGNRLSNVTVRNVRFMAPNGYGLFVGNSSGNTFSNILIDGIHGLRPYGLRLLGAGGNSFTKTAIRDISGTEQALGVYGSYLQTTNNKLSDTTIEGIANTGSLSYSFAAGVLLRDCGSANAFAALRIMSLSDPNGRAYGASLSNTPGSSVSDSSISGVAVGLRLLGAADTTLTANMIDGSSSAGIVVDSSARTAISANTLSNCGYGIYVCRTRTQACAELDISGSNRILGNQVGVYVEPGTGGPSWDPSSGVHNNDIVGNTVCGVKNDGTVVVDATQNWWGANSGPGGLTPPVYDPITGQEADGAGDLVSVNVHFDPFTVHNRPPVAVALVNGEESVEVEQQTPVGTEVTLDGTGSSDPDGDTLSYAWDFETDGTVDSTDAVVNHTYNLGGPYTAALTVTDPCGETSTDTVTVTVVDTTPPVVTITSPSEGATYYNTRPPLPVTATAADICDSSPVVTTTLDGATFTGSSINLSSLSVGDHVLAVTATDASANASTARARFTVVPQPLACFDIEKLKIEWRGRCRYPDKLMAKGDLSLPAGLTPDDLKPEVTVTVQIDGQTGTQLVPVRVKRDYWDYDAPGCRRPPGSNMTLDGLKVKWSRYPSRPGSFEIRADLPSGVFNDRSGVVTITMALSLKTGGGLSGTDTVQCRIKGKEWQYHRGQPWGHGDHGCGVVALTSLSAVPTPRGAQVVFALSGEARVSATVLNLAGRPVRQLAADVATGGGMNSLVWDASTDGGPKAPSGMYLVRVTCQSPDGGTSTGVTTVRLSR